MSLFQFFKISNFVFLSNQRREPKVTNSMERSRPSVKKLTKEIKEMEISEVDDLDLEDLG